jgi:hypothetical protein
MADRHIRIPHAPSSLEIEARGKPGRATIPSS